MLLFEKQVIKSMNLNLCASVSFKNSRLDHSYLSRDDEIHDREIDLVDLAGSKYGEGFVSFVPEAVCVRSS